jgi:hypothetical protein
MALSSFFSHLSIFKMDKREIKKRRYFFKTALSFFKKWSSFFFSQLLIFKMKEQEEKGELVFF